MTSGWIDFFEQKLYPFTLKHLIYLALITIVTTYITEYVLRIRLLKWIYFGTVTVIIATLYNKGDDKAAALNIFRLATI